MALERVLQENVIATGVSFEEYMEKYAADFAEWVDGDVIKMSPVRHEHAKLSGFLLQLFEDFLYFTGGGEVLMAPMVMKLVRGREPDIQVILPTSAERIKETMIAGAADLVVEIISPESIRRDKEIKLAEYERGGVKEYWVLDQLEREPFFYVLGADGKYERRYPDEHGVYHSVILKGLRLKIEWLWREPLLRGPEIEAVVREMLNV
jgi:Uma2 family endonuclease